MNENTFWDWEFAREVFPELIAAFLQFTLTVTAASAALAIVLGLILVLLRRSHTKAVAWPVVGFLEFVRSTPIPIQLFFVFYAAPAVGLQLSALTTGILVLGIHYASYMSEVYRAGIDAIPKGQWEACTALALSPTRTWKAVILPQVIRRIIPSICNQIVALFKETPFLIVIGVSEMVTVANRVGAEQYRYIEPLTIAGLIFLAASYPISVAMRKLEARLGH